jgi:hypothetical protein
VKSWQIIGQFTTQFINPRDDQLPMGTVLKSRILADLLVVLIPGEMHSENRVVVIGAGKQVLANRCWQTGAGKQVLANSAAAFAISILINFSTSTPRARMTSTPTR